MKISDALDPQSSVVVEACAGSGKTWLLVSRMVRLLLDGVQPSNILAITFTRKAAQEMQARLQLWLRELATEDEAHVRKFFAERGLESLNAEQVQRARSLHGLVLLAQPGLTISTFHGWFMQVMQRAPMNAGVMQGMSLLERAGSVQEEAWEELLDHMRQHPESAEAAHMQWLFAEYGLHNTRQLMQGFLARRGEWWAYAAAFAPEAYTQSDEDEAAPESGDSAADAHEMTAEADVVALAVEKLQAELAVEIDFDPVADWGLCQLSDEALFAFARQLATDGTAAQQKKAGELERAWTDSEPEARFDAVWPLLFTQAGEPRKLSATKKQDETRFAVALANLQASLQAVRDAEAEQQAYRLNAAALHCGAALLARYQNLKRQMQQMDFADLEWELCRLLQQSEHAETMQYKLDCRYRHVLLDEFQDTNPLQWQTLRAWFDAAASADARPTVFIVGDPKQSIYRFRRAEARLFGVAREYLKEVFGARTLHNNHTRRNAPAVLDAVNAVFAGHPEGFDDFEPHTAEHTALPGHVHVLPLAQPPEAESAEEAEGVDEAIVLRDPLTTPRAELEESARQREAEQFAELLQTMVREWQVGEGGEARPAAWGDIMVLVRGRTHLATYEEALRAKHIPFISSRRGGLLDTLEAEDIQALLMFLITPFADLALAQVLRTPIFSCSDEDLMRLAKAPSIAPSPIGSAGTPARAEENAEDMPPDGDRGAEVPPPDKAAAGPMSWWQRLQALAEPTPALQRAAELLSAWLTLADKLPVHDLLDRIYFEGDVLARYSAAQLPETRAKAAANLHAFMEIALAVDAGRYPSLPRFLQELRELRASTDDAPDEGRLGVAGDAVRIYTVHESKGLEAPIVWLLDANGARKNSEGYGILLDWPAQSTQPEHFSFYGDLASRGNKRAPIFEQEAAQQAREEMNLLYVAMTRAQQALIVSGNGRGEEKEQKKKSPSWYDRIQAVCAERENPLARPASAAKPQEKKPAAGKNAGVAWSLLPALVPIGQRKPRLTAEQQRGIWLHALLQHLTASTGPDARAIARLGIPPEVQDAIMQQAEALIARPELARFFDPAQYRRAANEMPYVNARGELRRIDRLVEFGDEVWVLDYKLTESADVSRYRAQMEEYRSAMQAVYEGQAVRCALVFGGGVVREV